MGRGNIHQQTKNDSSVRVIANASQAQPIYPDLLTHPVVP
jgi:hypothetical protein